MKIQEKFAKDLVVYSPLKNVGKILIDAADISIWMEVEKNARVQAFERMRSYVCDSISSI